MKFASKADDARTTYVGDEPRRLPNTEIEANDASRAGVYLFFLLLFSVGFLVTLGICALFTFSIYTFFISLFAGFCVAMSVRIAPQWERVALLRLGKFTRIAGPGVYFCAPFIEYPAMHVDQRVTTTSFSAEAALTADLVPVDVDAILFWMVWDPEKACFEVENYPKAVLRSAQTALRDVIGQLNLADISMRRKQIDHELEEILAPKCEEWGITVMSVEIRDIMIPKELQDALSREAQAERERNARVILAEVEKDISEMFVEAADVYDRNPAALKLRAMNMAYEGVQKSGGMLLAPSELANAFDVSRVLKDL